MVKCALCQATFSSKHKLVLHFGDAHSVAKQRSRRSKVTEAIKRIVAEEDEEEENREVTVLEEDLGFITSTRQPLSCSECGEQFATRASLQGHQCSSGNEAKTKKQPVTCQYCGQKCKDRRGAAIHLAFCDQRYKTSAVAEQNQVIDGGTKSMENMSTFYECPGEDCGAIFKNQDQLAKHIQKHHGGEGIIVIRSSSPPASSPVYSNTPQFELPPITSPQKPTQQPLVTVTMKPHIGKTEGLQDLSLLITPTKGLEETPSFPDSDGGDSSLSEDEGLEKETPTITVEECRALESGFNGNSEAVLYVAEDGTLIETSQSNVQPNKTEFHSILGEKDTFLVFSNGDVKNHTPDEAFRCKFCNEQFLKKKSLSEHIKSVHISGSEKIETVHIKKEPVDSDEDRLGNMDEDWELVTVGKRKKLGIDFKIEKGNFEYKCKLCRRNFLSELAYQTHVRNKECKNKKFKLTRMFTCHFQRCDSSFFKLTELQRHWQIAHKFSMASKNLEFKDERAFTEWLVEEEESNKVRFTCDVKRRKPHRTERLLVCHRFHHLRTAAARKAAKQEYSDKHNWIHKIQPCLCFARMKVYQDFDKDTCDFTGKINVVYYYEHSHPNDETQEEKTEILEHILQRNKRNRKNQFQDLKGNDKLMHRQKLEKFARLAGKEYRSTTRSTKTIDSIKRFKQEPDELPSLNEYDEDQIAAANVANNLLGSDELFTTQVEMVLDGQFDMGQEVLTGPVVNHIDGLAIFEGNKVEHIKSDDLRGHDEDTETDEDSQTLQVVLPASTADWGKLFEMVRARVSNDPNPTIKAEAALVLPYEKVIELISPNEQIPIFRQLWELAYPSNQSEEEIEFEIRMVR